MCFNFQRLNLTLLTALRSTCPCRLRFLLPLPRHGSVNFRLQQHCNQHPCPSSLRDFYESLSEMITQEWDFWVTRRAQI